MARASDGRAWYVLWPGLEVVEATARELDPTSGLVKQEWELYDSEAAAIEAALRACEEKIAWYRRRAGELVTQRVRLRAERAAVQR